MGKVVRPLSKKLQAISELIIYALRHNNLVPSSLWWDTLGRRAGYEVVHEMGLFHRTEDGYLLNIDLLQECAYVIPDDIYDKFKTREGLAELKGKKVGKKPDRSKNVKTRQACRLSQDELKRQAGEDFSLKDILLKE